MSEFDSLKETLTKIDSQLNNLESLFKEKLKMVYNEVKRIIKSVPKAQEELVSIENRIQDDDVKAERLRATRSDLEHKINAAVEETDQLKDELKTVEQENSLLEENLRNLEAEINQETWSKSSLEKDAEQVRRTASDLNARIDAKKKANENEFIEKKLHLDQVKRELKQLEERETVITFLLKESSQNLPEVDILRILKETPVTQLDTIKANITMPPALVNRTLVKLGEHGIIEYDQGRAIIKLIKEF
ncbi:MAG: hypothetical protein ACTSW4_05735 [Candidatus Ranarchaeia archaeon]